MNTNMRKKIRNAPPRYYVNISDHTAESENNSPFPHDDGNRFISAYGRGSKYCFTRSP